MFLIDNILLAPVKAVIWVGKKINEVVDKELSDEGRIKEKLIELQQRLELDEITEEEYTREEKDLLARLDAIRKRKEEV